MAQNVIKILTWGDYPGRSGWALNATTSIPRGGRQERCYHRGEGLVSTKTETGMMSPGARSPQNLAAAGADSLLEPCPGNTDC